jgi:penicillin amidase
VKKINARVSLLATAAIGALCFQISSAEARVVIDRDAYGVPYILGDTDREAFFGYGYAMAEDRLIQISKLRYLSNGVYPKDNEQTGKKALAGKEKANSYLSDYPYLQEDIRRELDALRQAYEQDEDARRAVDALECVAAGINAFLVQNFKQMPAAEDSCNPREAITFRGRPLSANPQELAYIAERFADEADFLKPTWTAEDMLKIFQNRVMDEFSNRNEEVNNLALLREFERQNPGQPEKARRIFNSFKWVADPHAITEVKNLEQSGGISLREARAVVAGYRQAKHTELLKTGGAICPSIAGGGVGKESYDFAYQGADKTGFAQNASNFWAVSGDRLAKPAKSVMYNGPQIGAYDPNGFYPFKLKSGSGFQYAGTSFAGTFTTFTGHNGKIATGFTAGNSDVADMFCIPVRADRKVDGHTTFVGEDDLRLLKTPGTPKSYHVKGMGWPVSRLEVGADGRAVAYIKRVTWQGQTGSSFKSFLALASAQNMEQWQGAATGVGANFNLIGSSDDGTVTMRLAGVIPPRVNSNGTALKNLKDRPDRLLWDADVRLPVPVSPAKGWHDEVPDYYVQNETTNNGTVVSWNHKPYLLMPDSDLYYDAWYAWDRAQIIEDILSNVRDYDIEKASNVNTLLTRLDINYHMFRPYLARLTQSGTLPEELAPIAQSILKWDGMRGAPGKPGGKNCVGRLPSIPQGQVLFMDWYENLGAAFSEKILGVSFDRLAKLKAKATRAKTEKDVRLTAGETSELEELNRRLSVWRPYGKLKQPMYSKQAEGKPKLIYNTSQNVYILGKMMLINLKFAFGEHPSYDETGWNFLLGKAADRRDGKKTVAAGYDWMIAALRKTALQNTGPAYSSCHAIATMANNAIVMSTRDEKALAFPYFRNRGAQNHAVQFNGVSPEPASGQESNAGMRRLQAILRQLAPETSFEARNIAAPGVREYRGISWRNLDPTDNQLQMLNTDQLRPMGKFGAPSEQ